MGYSKQFMNEISNSCKSWADSSPYEGDYNEDIVECDNCEKDIHINDLIQRETGSYINPLTGKTVIKCVYVCEDCDEDMTAQEIEDEAV